MSLGLGRRLPTQSLTLNAANPVIFAGSMCGLRLFSFGPRLSSCGTSSSAPTNPCSSYHSHGSLLANASVMHVSAPLAAATENFGVRSFKSKSALRLRCPHCFFAKRGGRLRVICKENPKHKQVQI
ncbi:hypothetical protein BC830DRAFT_1105865 [Chytriomyces sp. MP71]|nr:hypothetical protein BC830DRAFT_1105865 [Chytriomyces sp. MP71]